MSKPFEKIDEWLDEYAKFYEPYLADYQLTELDIQAIVNRIVGQQREYREVRENHIDLVWPPGSIQYALDIESFFLANNIEYNFIKAQKPKSGEGPTEWRIKIRLPIKYGLGKAKRRRNV